MTLTEFGYEFDIIYENISKGGAPGLIPYEKSVILTQAAEMLALQLVQEDISLVANLIKTVKLAPSVTVLDKIDSRAIGFDLPSDTLKILEESVIDNASNTYVIVPMMPSDHMLMMMKPYQYPRRRTAWRIENSDLSDGVLEIIPRNGVTLSYYVARILTLPDPIILETLTGGLTLRGATAAGNTNLLETLHPRILDVAVKLAEQYYLDKYPQGDGT